MNRLNGKAPTVTMLKIARAARPDSAVGITADMSCRIDAGTASKCSFAAAMRLLDADQPLLRVGEVRRQLREHHRDLVAVRAASGPRYGSRPARPPRSGRRGSPSWSSSQRRSAVVHSAITTSLTVIANAFLTVLISSSGSDPYANRR